MQRKDIKIRSRDGGDFDCYLVTPDAAGQVPAIVLASAVHGVDKDIRSIADEFASNGYIAAAPDLFWHSIRLDAMTIAPRRARSRGSRRSRRVKRTWRTR